MDLKLQKLYDNNYLIKVGEDNKKPVYGINGHLYDGTKVNRIEPNFSKENLERGKKLFEDNYPSCKEEMESFVNENKYVRHTSELFLEKLMNEKPIYKLGWLS